MHKVVIINSETMGKGRDELGKKILGSFFRKIGFQKEKPDAIIFYNSGVKLVAEGSPFLADLEISRKLGVDLIACGTCVGYFNLTDKIVVGRVSDMQEIAQVIMKAESVVTL